MNTTLTVGAALGTVGLLLMPTTTVESEPVEIDWALHGEAPSTVRNETVFHLPGRTSMLVAQRNTYVSSNAVVKTDHKSEEVRAMSKRINHLRTLSDGWVGRGSIAPSSVVLSWLEAHTELLSTVRGASLIPLEDGSVALRWEHENLDFTAEVRPNMTLYTLIDDIDSDDLEEHVEPLTDQALSRFLATHSPV